MVPKRKQNGTWVYPPIGAVLTMLGPEDIWIYISRRQNKIAKYIETRPIMELYLAAERNTGIRLYRRWWEHPPLDTMGIGSGQTAT